MIRRDFLSAAFGKLLALLAAIFAAPKAAQAIVLPGSRPSTSPPPKTPRDLLREYLGLPTDLFCGAIVDLNVTYKHPDIDRICRVLKATVYFSKGNIPKHWKIPLQPGYKREKLAITTSCYNHIVHVEVIDVLVQDA